MTPHRLLVIIPSLRAGGAERVICTLLRHLDRRRFEPTLVIVDGNEAVYRRDLPPDLEIVDLGCRRVRQALGRIVWLLWQRRPDVVLSTLGHMNLALSMARPFLPRSARFVAREASLISLLPSHYSLYFWWGWAYRRFMRLFDAIVCQCEPMQRDLVDNYSVPRSKTVVIGNPVDTALVRERASEASPPRRGAVQLVAVGSLLPVKGFDLLIEALALCRDPRMHLSIVGEGPMRAELEVAAARRGLQDRVHFEGFQQNPYPFIAAADVLVSSSRFEGLPNVVLEALAIGTPVIATPSPGGVQEVLTGVEGCVLARDVSAPALAEALQSLPVGHRLSSDAADRFAAPVIVREYERVLAG